MSVPQYPTPTVFGGDTNVVGPPILKRLLQVVEFAGTQKLFKDLGATYGLPSTSSVLRWELRYDGMDETQAGVLDTHWAAAQGIFGGFSFRDPKTSILYTDVHYESMTADHTKSWSQARTVVLVKRPA